MADGLSFGRDGSDFVLESRLLIERPRGEVFAFFADAANLEAITPPWLRFRILSPQPIAMRTGALIDYRLSLHGLPLGWRSEITAWEPPHRFVDEQRRGPYRRWRHEHVFSETATGTLVEDRVRYRVWGGRLLHAAFVRRELEAIFRFRQRELGARLAPAPAAIAAEDAAV